MVGREEAIMSVELLDSMTGGGNSSLYVAGLYATGAVTAGAGNSDNVGGVVGFQI